MWYKPRPLPLQPRHRPCCLVCDDQFEGKPTKRRLVCDKSTCRYQLKTHPECFAHKLENFVAKSTTLESAENRPVSSAGIAHNAQNPPTISTLKNGQKLGRAFRVSELIQFDTMPINVGGGYRFPGAKKIEPALLRRIMGEERK